VIHDPSLHQPSHLPTILVVEDNFLVRLVAVEFLEIRRTARSIY
jgi:CheY-like chemotaxis protein